MAILVWPSSAATLKVGDPAPKLQVSKWVQGEPVKEFAKDKAYIVEFWATWCGPCRATIPHLNELHNQFKDKGLVVIGQNVWERDLTQVEPFIKKMGDKMTYRVALDKVEGDKGAMAETWMEAAGQNGIPAAFLIGKDGKIAWIGHPMNLKPKTIEDVLAGKYDVKKAAVEQEELQAKQGKVGEMGQKLTQQIQNKEWETAMSTIDDMEKTMGPESKTQFDMVRLSVLMQKGDWKEVFKKADTISLEHKDNPQLLNQLAWGLATRDEVQERDLEVIDRIATRANDASNKKDPAVLDTLARVKFMKGEKEQAVQLQQKAVELADSEMKEDLQKTLTSYKEGKIPTSDGQ